MMAYNATHIFETFEASDQARTVTWEKAFFEIIALALYATAQRTAADKFGSLDEASPASSSPSICLAHILVFPIWCFRGFRLHYRFTRICEDYETWMGLKPSEARRNLRDGTPVWGLLLFVFVLLLPAVKLFFMDGIPYTKAMGAFYVLASLQGIAIRFFASLDTTSPSANANKKEWETTKYISKIIYGLGYFTTVILWGVTTWWILKPKAPSTKCPTCSSPYVLSKEIGIFDRDVGNIPTDIRNLTYVFLAVFGVASGCTVVVIFLDWAIIKTGEKLFLPSLRGKKVVNLGARVLMPADEKAYPKTKRFLSIAFAFTNLIFAVLGYRYNYYEFGTRFPSWLERLP